MKLLWVLLISLIPLPAQTAQPLSIQVYGNRVLSDESVIQMSGLDQDPTLSALEAKRRLETSSLFSRVNVKYTGSSVIILIQEKLTWFALPYFSSDPTSKIYGLAGGKASPWGQNGNIIGRYQFGTRNHQGAFLIRDEFFLNTLWALGVSFDYESAAHRIYEKRRIIHWTHNKFHGGSIQAGYHLLPRLLLSLNTYIEQHKYEELNGTYSSGLQLSHRLAGEYGNFTQNEGIARGASIKPYFETTQPLSDFQFVKIGVAAQASLFLKGTLNWITRPKYEWGSPLPRYQLFEIGAATLRSYPSQQFRDDEYISIQNDFLLTCLDVWKLKLRPLLYTDWAFIQHGNRTGLGTGFYFYFKNVTVPALQFFAGYGFNPNGFSMSAAIGPQF